MDLSVFNFLISTNPNAPATENSVSNAVQGDAAAVADASQEKIRTGEAFLKVLKDVRSGKAEKNADILYNMASARADASSSLKDLKKGGNSRENVKVVKLYIKRTRASETLRKADESKTVAATAAVEQDGQKIPARENIAAANENMPVQAEQNDIQNTPEAIVFEKITRRPEEDADLQEKISLPNEDLTAADILIHSALQTTFVPLSQSASTVRFEQPDEKSVPSGDFLPEQIADDVVPLQKKEPHQERQIMPEASEAPQNLPAFIPAPSTGEQEENVSVMPQQEKDFTAIQTKKDEKHAFVIEKERPVEQNIDIRPEHKRPHVVEKARSQVPEATAAHTVEFSKKADAAEIIDFMTVKGKTETSEAHRQAEQLANQLPAQTNIAISVETQVSEIKAFVLPHETSRRSVSVKNEDTDADTVFPALSETEKTEAAETEKSFHPQQEKTKDTRLSVEQPEQAEQPDGLIALPAQNKALSSSEALSQAESQTTGIEAPSSAQAPAAIFSVGHELKGKAVSGSAPVQKNIPVNELVEQIKINIKKAFKEGLDKIDIVLKPKELGTIKIHLEIGKDGTMKAVLNTARAETLDLLQSDLTVLKQALADSGFDLNDQAFSFNYRGERYNDEQKQPQNRRTVSSAEAEDETAEESAGTLSISGRYALNIKV